MTFHKERWFGDRVFYKMLFSISIPIMIQNGITNFVGLLDNVMIGQIGTDAMSGVSIVNQILFVYNLCIFGAVSGAGIFTAQYYGQKNKEGVQYTVRFKALLCIVISLLMIFLCLTNGNLLIGLFLNGEGSAANIQATLNNGRNYMLIMLAGLPFFMLTQIYGSTLKACSHTMLPMKAGIIAILINLVLNYVLIYGKFGFPVLGVSGAAIATVCSRLVECAIVLITVHVKHSTYDFVEGLYHTFYIPKDVAGKIIRKGTPLLVNETMWGAGMSTLAACYSLHGLHVVGAMNITNTIGNLFNIVLIAMGEAVAIIVGQILGTGDMKRAKDTATKIIVISLLLCMGVAAVLILVAPVFPKFYNTSNEIRHMATILIILVAVFIPQNALLNTCYFTLRSGGKTILAFFFDSFYIWCFNIPVAFLLTKFTSLNIFLIFTCVQLADTVKTILGLVLVKKGIWLQKIVD